MIPEIWKPVTGWEEKYQVSNHGRVRSLNYRSTGRAGLLKPVMEGKGYLMVRLCRPGGERWAKVHRLVAAAFIPNPEGKPQVNHLNGVKTDNAVWNLEWSTDSENLRHAYRHGLKRGDPERGRALGSVYGSTVLRASALSRRKPVLAKNLQTGEETEYASAADVERALGINHSSVPKVCDGRQKSAKGYTFRYLTSP